MNKNNGAQELPTSVGVAIREQRQALGLTQAELAEKLGRAKSTVSKIEGGSYPLSVAMLGEIAAALETTATKLVWEHERGRLQGDPVGRRLSKILDQFVADLGENRT